jgi:pimeloyl-ACP methyl ester carboxylesterase
MKARLNGIEIEYQDGGRGPAVLLGHGYSATGRMWDGQRAARRCRIISWDMRGPGGPSERSASIRRRSPSPTWARCSGATSAVIGGLSLGGYVSLAFYLAHPEMVRALVICDSGPGYRNAEARAAWNKRAHERAAELESKGLEVLAGRSREMREAMGHHASAQGLAHSARGMLAQDGSEVIDGLGTIKVPTLVIVGDQDTPFLAPCEYMAKKIPGARLEVIHGAGHSSNLDQPAIFNRVLGDFLGNL